MIKEITVAKEDNLSEIEDLINSSFKHYLPVLGHKPTAMDTDYLPFIQNKQLFIIKNKSELIASMVVVEYEDHTLLRNVAVNPDYQKKGYGKILLNFVEAETRKRSKNSIKIYTNRLIPELIKYWSSRGFKETSQKSNRVYMIKKLS